MPSVTKNTNPDPRSSRMLSLYEGEPSGESESKWVNRLKRSAPDLLEHHAEGSRLEVMESSPEEKINHASGETINQVMESSPEEKINYASGETINHNMMALELKEDYKNTVSSDRFASLPKELWIRRWLHNPAVFLTKKDEAMPNTKPGISEKKIDHNGEKQCPSIGAMALMAKALNGCWSCDFKKSGALVVWSTRRV